MHPMISLPDPHPPSDRRDSRVATELTNKEENNVKDILARASNGIMFLPEAAENSNESHCPVQDCGRYLLFVFQYCNYVGKLVWK